MRTIDAHTSTGVRRLGVFDRGESAVRVLHAVGGLNSVGDAPEITTVLLHSEPADPTPWDGREADEVRLESSDECIWLSPKNRRSEIGIHCPERECKSRN